MNILVTGAKGFVGKNLIVNLEALRDGKNRTRPGISVGEIFAYDIDNTEEELADYCARCDFVFNLAGVNRPHNPEDFRKGNFGFASKLLELLKAGGNKAPVMLSSSIQASLAGRFGTSEYGLSKRAGEELFFEYGAETGAPVYVYRFPNLAGKWVRPNYNSAVGTFCYNVARDLPITINDPNTEIELLFIDDLLEAMYDALEGKPCRCDYPAAGETVKGDGIQGDGIQGDGIQRDGIQSDGMQNDCIRYDGLTPYWHENGRYCGVPVTHKVRLGYIAECLERFRHFPENIIMPEIAPGSFEKKLYSMYLSYLPAEKAVFGLRMNKDARGSFTELLKTANNGQISVNITKPGVTKGMHWHNSKWELFIVVSGRGLIRERRIDDGEVLEYEVSGDNIQAVHMLPGYTHSITNLSETEDLVTVMWANEIFDGGHPDTFFEPV